MLGQVISILCVSVPSAMKTYIGYRVLGNLEQNNTFIKAL